MAQHFVPTSRSTGQRQTRFGAAGTPGSGAISPTRLIIWGGIGVLVLAGIFLLATFNAVQTLDRKSVDLERDRAAIAIGLTQQTGAAMDTVLARKIGRDYILADAQLIRPDRVTAEQVSLPVAGTSLVFAWTPRRLGSETFQDVAPLRIVSAGLVALGMFVVLIRLHRLARDLDHRRRAARDLATRDALTGIGNRRGFVETLTTRFAAGEPLTLFYLDLDNFKPVNDRFGHATGDELLLCVAQRLANIAGPRDYVARMGGDEFAILRHGAATRADLEEFAALIQSRVTLPYGLGDVEARVGVSVGIAERSEHMAHADDLVSSADAALYRAKATPGLHYAFAEPLVVGLPRAA